MAQQTLNLFMLAKEMASILLPCKSAEEIYTTSAYIGGEVFPLLRFLSNRTFPITTDRGWELFDAIGCKRTARLGCAASERNFECPFGLVLGAPSSLIKLHNCLLDLENSICGQTKSQIKLNEESSHF